MHAWVCETPTGLDAVVWKESPTPQPAAGQVLVEIRAASLNFPDLLIVQNKYQHKPEPPFVPGSEFAGVVVAVGDGKGGMLGAVPMKKMVITDKGKGWAGITVKDPELLEVARSFMRATKWRGPCEVEVMRDDRGKYQLLEINPRFPAWVYLSAAAGQNLPRAAVEVAMGGKPVLGAYSVGTMFVRISLDQIAGLGDLERMLTAGEISRIRAVVGQENTAVLTA